MKPDYGISWVHQANLTILKEIGRICRKYNIKYMLDAGTLTGAVRHKEFVPWDDGAGATFARSQYDAFMEVVKREFPQGPELVEPDGSWDGKGFYGFTTRIIYKSSRCHEDSLQMRFYEGKPNHLWVDLFVIDRLPAGRMGASITKLPHMAVCGMAVGHRYELDFKKCSLANEISVDVLAGAGRCVPMKAIFSMQRALALKDGKNKGRLRCYSSYQPDFLYVTTGQDWCDNVEGAPSEGTQLMIPKDWHEVLTLLYGDYMQLPPEEQRAPARSSIEIGVSDQSELEDCFGSE